MDLSSVFAERADLELDLGKLGKISVTYDPQFYTPALEAQIEQETRSGTLSVQWLVATIHGLIRGWDLLIGTAEQAAEFGAAVGEPVPLTRVAIARLPASFLLALFDAFISASKNANSSVS